MGVARAQCAPEEEITLKLLGAVLSELCYIMVQVADGSICGCARIQT